MKFLYLIILLTLSSFSLFSQGTKPMIIGKLNTGELLSGIYSSSIYTNNKSYAWRTANDAIGTFGLAQVGKSQTYRLLSQDAGKYIRFEVSVSAQKGKPILFVSDWYGPIKNGIPLIRGNVTLSGTLKVDQTLTSNYLYDPNNYPESGSSYKWYQAESSRGAYSIVISVSGSTFLLTKNQVNKYIRVEVTPHDNGGTAGSAYSSSWIGPVNNADISVNQPPVATNVRINGNPVVCGVLTGLYDYFDTEQNTEGSSLYRWLIASGLSDAPIPIPNATNKTYTITANDQNKYIYFEVTPKAVSGNITGKTIMGNPTSQVQGTLPTVSFAGNASICEGTSTMISLSFTGMPPFTLEYTNGANNFNLTTSNLAYQLKVSNGGIYKGVRLTDNLNCPVSSLPSSVTILIEPKSKVSFTSENACWTGDSSIFKNTSPNKESFKTWKWNFGDQLASEIQNNSSLPSPKHNYSSTGKYIVQLIGENMSGCKDTATNIFQLGEKPVADFNWDRECFVIGNTTNFNNMSTGKDNISMNKWSIQNDNKVIKEASSSNLSYNIPALGIYGIKLKISTDGGCQDSITKILMVKPTYYLQDSSYADNFEKVIPSWNIAQKTKNNWYWGQPDGQTIKTTNSLSHSYYTTFPEQEISQQLVVSSPCFDFTNIQNPFLQVWINYASQESVEGAVLQYIQDGDTAWKVVGGHNTGINWYNSNIIASKPGNQQMGWSGNSNGWIQARQSLDSLSNKTNIRFRIVYASIAGAIANDGFAFDDFFIGQGRKKVLFEHFTNLSDPTSNRSNLSMDSILHIAGSRTVSIQYHTSFPGPDSINAQNIANPSARILYYGIGNIPASCLDGGTEAKYMYDFVTQSPNMNDINIKTLNDAGFNLKISSAIANNIISGSINLVALKNMSVSGVSLYIAIVEDIKIQSGNKTTTLHNVLKYLYPSAAGTSLKMNWVKGQSEDVPYSWKLTNVYSSSKLKVIAFVQNNLTREVYQVDIADNSIITSSPSLKSDETQNLTITAYPNPTTDRASISFGKVLVSDFEMQIINKEGKVVATMPLQEGTSILDLSLNNIQSGMYFIRVFNKKGETKTAKLIIVR